MVRPLCRERDWDAMEVAVQYYTGAPRMVCPVATSRMIAALCEDVLRIRSSGPQVPLVINTHGWVMSSGRRATIEAMRRLRPEHAVHLLLPGDESWFDANTVHDVTQGLNSRVVAKRYQGLLESPLVNPDRLSCGTKGGEKEADGPHCATESNSSPYQVTVHRVRIRRDPTCVKHAAALRFKAWLRYFTEARSNLNDGSVAQSKGDGDSRSCVYQATIPLTSLYVISTGVSAVGMSTPELTRQATAALISHAMVGLVSVSATGGSSTLDGSTGSPVQCGCVYSLDAVPSLCSSLVCRGVGVVASSAHDICCCGELRIVSRMQSTTLQAQGINCIVVGQQHAEPHFVQSLLSMLQKSTQPSISMKTN